MRITLETNIHGVWAVSSGETTILFQWLGDTGDLLRQLADHCDGPVSQEEWERTYWRLATTASRHQK